MQPNIQAASHAGVLGTQQQKVLRNTYLLLSLTMIPTIIGAFIGMATAGIVYQHPIMTSLLMIGAMIGLQYAIAANRNSGLGIALLFTLTFILGWWLGPILNIALTLRNGPQLIGIAAGGTGAILLAMSAIATTTKRDFSFMGKFLFVGMIVLLLAAVANMFFQIPALMLTISALAVVIFSMFLLHDVSRIVNGGETNYIMAATGVYISLWAIFANLLQLLMALAGQRE
ncbi:MAG: Bax inhibitor-1/YccA family protein [Burkholderiales bacterium]|jgi:FtsH-binding integral membrane protein